MKKTTIASCKSLGGNRYEFTTPTGIIYTTFKFLGDGSYGNVYLAKTKDGDQAVLKQFKGEADFSEIKKFYK